MLQEKIHYNTALYSNEGRVIVITNSYSNEHLKLWGERSTLPYPFIKIEHYTTLVLLYTKIHFI